MSPIIELQRRMVEAGRIRAGEKGAKGEPRKLDKWRLTSKDEQRLKRAADLWGGESRVWEGHPGEFELYTEVASLPIMLLPGHLPTTWYELWSKGGCQRRCDGAHEIISDSSCLCGEERECKPHTRLSVLLPDLPGIGSWLLSSTGWNAAAELAGAADLLQRASAQGVLIPARLRLEQRVQIKGGQTRRYAVPVIDIDVAFRELLGAQGALSHPSETRALPSGYIPITPDGGNGTSLEVGLRAAETQTLTKPPRVPLPDDDVDDEPSAEPSPTAALSAEGAGGSGNEPASSALDEPGVSPLPTASADAGPSDAPVPTYEENIAALNALVGTMREAGTITTRQLWVKVARMRKTPVDEMIDLYDGVGEDGELHWSPLRQIIRPEEAVELRKALGALWAKTQAGAAA